jgi:Ice-binding-like
MTKSILLAMVASASLVACSSATMPAASGPSASGPLTVRQIKSPPNMPVVDLRSAATFTVLAGSTVTSTGPTSIAGNVGIFPGSARTGFPPAVITQGAFYSADGTSQQAELDVTTAYNDAMGRVLAPVSVAGNLGGQTLAPGLYKSTSGLAVSSGDLTLDGQGNTNAVFIFQMATTLNMTTGRSVILIRGARPRNIFWAVGSSATLGTGCSFFGTILAHQSISIATGTVMKGRALARIGAVTMQSDTVVLPGD